MARFQSEYFDRSYDFNQLRLVVLGTHPRYRRQGMATALCKWGMEQAVRDNVPITLISSQMGRKLYTHIGFRKLGEEHVRSRGEKQSLTVYAMEFHPTSSTAPRVDLR